MSIKEPPGWQELFEEKCTSFLMWAKVKEMEALLACIIVLFETAEKPIRIWSCVCAESEHTNDLKAVVRLRQSFPPCLLHKKEMVLMAETVEV